MALPASGPLSASQINVELGRAVGAAFSMNDAAVRSLAGKPSGPISFGDLLGKSMGLANLIATGYYRDVTNPNYPVRYYGWSRAGHGGSLNYYDIIPGDSISQTTYEPNATIISAFIAYYEGYGSAFISLRASNLSTNPESRPPTTLPWVNATSVTINGVLTKTGVWKDEADLKSGVVFGMAFSAAADGYDVTLTQAEFNTIMAATVNNTITFTFK